LREEHVFSYTPTLIIKHVWYCVVSKNLSVTILNPGRAIKKASLKSSEKRIQQKAFGKSIQANDLGRKTVNNSFLFFFTETNRTTIKFQPSRCFIQSSVLFQLIYIN